MQTKLNDMRAALDLLENEMRNIGWWQSIEQRPTEQALSSIEPFCVDTLSFSEWLQWVYTPKMHSYMNQTGTLPTTSGLLPIAEEAWKKHEPHTKRLLLIIHLLDEIITGEHLSTLQKLINYQ